MKHEEQNRFMKQALDSIGMQASEEQLESFVTYYEMLADWNTRMNLTAITAFEEVVRKHFIDSLMMEKTGVLPCKDLLDIGTGAGFPGIPLKIMYPSVHVTLLDALQKRIGFLNAVCDTLKLQKIEALHGRAEELGCDLKMREMYDVVTSRAVADLAVLSEYAIPLVKPGGCFIAYKGSNASEELERSKRAISLLGGETEQILQFVLPGSEEQRALIMIRKVRETPEKYPRRSNQIQKKSLADL